MTKGHTYQKLPLQEMRHFYVTGHEMGIAAAFEKIGGAF